MIQYFNKDITKLERGIIVHGVNCQGVMNSGVAKAIRNKWPEVYDGYMEEFEENKPRPDMLGNANAVWINDNLFVFNAFTQEYYGKDGAEYASVKAIESCLESIIRFMKIANGIYTVGLNTISMPKIGCGLGGLDWNTDVLPILERFTKSEDVCFNIYYIDK